MCVCSVMLDRLTPEINHIKIKEDKRNSLALVRTNMMTLYSDKMSSLMALTALPLSIYIVCFVKVLSITMNTEN